MTGALIPIAIGGIAIVVVVFAIALWGGSDD